MELPPGPRAPAAWQTVGWTVRPAAFLRRVHSRFGDPVTIRTFLTDEPMVLFSDPDAVRALSEIRRVTRGRAVIVDADGTPRGLVRRILLASDRGDWMRTPASLEQLVGSVLTVRESVRFRVGFYAELLFACDPS